MCPDYGFNAQFPRIYVVRSLLIILFWLWTPSFIIHGFFVRSFYRMLLVTVPSSCESQQLGYIDGRLADNIHILDKLWQTDKLLMGACLNFRSCILYSASIDILANESLVTQSTLDRHVTDCSSDINWESTASPPIYTNDCQSMNIHWHIIDILLTLDQLLLADWYISHHSIERRHIPINMLVITWLTVDRHATDVPFNYHIDR